MSTRPITSDDPVVNGPATAQRYYEPEAALAFQHWLNTHTMDRVEVTSVSSRGTEPFGIMTRLALMAMAYTLAEATMCTQLLPNDTCQVETATQRWVFRVADAKSQDVPHAVPGDGVPIPIPLAQPSPLAQAMPVEALPQTAPFLDKLKGWLCDDGPALSLMQDLLFICARWDDLVDRDMVLIDKDIHELMETTIGLATQPFYVAYFAQLYPLIQNAIRNWKVSLAMERECGGNELALHNAFILRSSYIDILGACATILKGKAWGEQVLLEARLFNSREGFELYKRTLEREQEVRQNVRR